MGLAPIGRVLVGPTVAAVAIDSTLWGAVVIFIAGMVGTLSIRQGRDLGNGQMTPQVPEHVVHGVGES
jgi:hypothetical protein